MTVGVDSPLQTGVQGVRQGAGQVFERDETAVRPASVLDVPCEIAFPGAQGTIRGADEALVGATSSLEIDPRHAKQVRAHGAIPAAAVLTLVTLFVPWSHEGSTDRSAYALAWAVERAGLVSTTEARVLVDALFGLPFIVGLTCAASVLGRLRVAAFLGALEGVVVVIASVVVLSQLRVDGDLGPWLGVAVGALTVILSIVLALWKKGLHVRHT